MVRNIGPLGKNDIQFYNRIGLNTMKLYVFYLVFVISI